MEISGRADAAYGLKSIRVIVAASANSRRQEPESAHKPLENLP
jgi:hypothetical protein